MKDGVVVTLHKFNDTKEYKQFEGVSGIYAFVCNEEVIYVGQSIDVLHRLRTHHSIDSNLRQGKNPRLYWFMKRYLDDIYFLVLPTESEKLIKTEKFYIEKYQPRFNYIGVKVPYTKTKRRRKK